MKPRRWEALLWSTFALAAVSVGLAAGPLPWRFAGESGLQAPEAAAPAGTAAPPVSIEPILDLALFGRLVRPAEPDAPTEETEETDLGLTLAGVIIAGDPGASGAIVAGPDGPAQAYGIGQEVTATATLAEVHGDHVILMVDGRPETLSFPQRDGMSTGVAAMRALVNAPDAPASEDDADPQAAIARYRERIASNPQTVLDNLGLVATEAGYEVADTASAGVLQAGLQPGDVVAKVNGQQVGDIERDRDFFDEVAASGRARIEVLRDGQRVVLSFPLR
ncbi:MAG: hypothetical protein H0T41_01270 [Rhodobacteraceae bacterium]|nr:hypothetical protein [Paracoccaceae bacterium]